MPPLTACSSVRSAVDGEGELGRMGFGAVPRSQMGAHRLATAGSARAVGLGIAQPSCTRRVKDQDATAGERCVCV